MKLKNGTLIKNVILCFLIFITGFIGSMLLIGKKYADMTTMIISAETEITEYVSFFGIKIVELQSKLVDGTYAITIVEHQLYDFIPFFVGFALLAIAFMLTVFTKLIMKKQ